MRTVRGGFALRAEEKGKVKKRGKDHRSLKRGKKI